ncbi:hypothetical protein [Labedaea rhizosphaerae]|uniref:SH3 domain-containing protein n=1 Tax=Labedaea rhizosphaerae TaxID=598644 RepID=A0A4R6SMU7_LABRH|nr:hypothetical protein [Labedaea rhizosphaerae]TDQ05628.1 hypothetical protein EV186_1011602 [Labedaea rhizosphaerae]
MGSTTRLVRVLATVAVATLAAGASAAVPPAAAAATNAATNAARNAATDDWTIDATTFTADSSNVRADGPTVRLADDADDAAKAASAGTPDPWGVAVYPPHTLSTPATGVTADADRHGAELDVRARRADGTWSQWLPLPAALPLRATQLQLRAVLTGQDAAVGPLTVHPDDSTRIQPDSADKAGLSYRVYATREGLIGHKTANGHKIAKKDHFVALPSRRALGANGSGEYSVRVCANKRCAWAPVWDVGPWNTTDDHWSTGTRRQRWKDLPQGTPEADAAYRKGYNKGKDQYGRKVKNPSGIDLADGTFHDGLRLKGNSYVTVTYQWTGTGAVGTVHTNGIPLNVRSGASSQRPNVGVAANKAQVRVECKLRGLWVSGTFGRNNVWYRLYPGMYVASVYVSGVSGVRNC